MGRLNGKIAIITGAAKGLGEADARLFADEGATVILTDMDIPAGERVAADIGRGAEFHQHNVCNEEEWTNLLENVVRRHGKLDILVNNAGIVFPGTIESQTTSEFDEIMDVSSKGTFFGCKYAVKAMKETGGGSIINMASIASLQGEANVFAYCAAKGAVEAMSRAVAVHCLKNGYKIRCNSIHPGTILTPMVKNIQSQMKNNKDTGPAQIKPDTSAMGEPNDIANAVLFLASDESKHVNGIELRVDNAAIIVP